MDDRMLKTPLDTKEGRNERSRREGEDVAPVLSLSPGFC